MPKMIIKQIHLQNFRNYSLKEFTFSQGINLVVGPNTAGKTNLLEAIYLLSSRRSFRARLEEEMIQRDEEIARIKGRILSDREKKLLEIILTRGEVNGSRVAKKKYLVNGVPRRMVDFLENFRVVYFGPQDLEIIVDSPSIRRSWLDLVLEQADKNYRRANLSYQKGLRQRNKLLEQIRDKGRPHSSLFFWDKLLIENGQLLTGKRQEFLNFINENQQFFGQLEIHYNKSLISEARLAKYEEEEIAAGKTLVGPHRDDFEVWRKKQNLHIYGSRGEQRTAVFNLKLAELEFLSEQSTQRASLLLDDIFSELDQQGRQNLLQVMPQQQTIMTTADINLIKKKSLKEMKIIELK
jgi:DNA replication and repair protein RecF